MSVYVSLGQFKSIVGTEVSAQDAKIVEAIGAASRYIDDVLTGRRVAGTTKMYPMLGTKRFDAVPITQSAAGILTQMTKERSREFRDDFPDAGFFGTYGSIFTKLRGLDLMGNEFIGVPSIEVEGGYDIESSDLTLYPVNSDCKNGIELKKMLSKSWRTATPEGAISISNVVWVKRVTNEQLWYESGAKLTSDLDIDDLTIPVTGSHEITQGTIIKIDDEVLNVKSIATGTVSALTRGDNGSTAATHSANSKVYYYNVEYLIREASIILARLFVKKPGSVTFFPNSGAVTREDTEYFTRARELVRHYSIYPFGG